MSQILWRPSRNAASRMLFSGSAFHHLESLGALLGNSQQATYSAWILTTPIPCLKDFYKVQSTRVSSDATSQSEVLFLSMEGADQWLGCLV